MTNVDAAYAALIADILDHGEPIVTRNSPVKRLDWVPVEFVSTPLVAVRKTAWKYALYEWEWFMSGSNFIDDLNPKVRHWWEPWAEDNGEIHFNYSRQFRAFSGDCGNVDSIALLIDGVKNHPFSRRNVITTWNTSDMNNSSCRITNCHGTVIHCFVNSRNELTLATYQRSVDVVCGLPHNWIQYAAFHLWLCARTGRVPGKLKWLGGDIHVYDCHAGLARRIVDAAPSCGPTPTLVYTPTSEEFRADDFTLDGEYKPVIDERAEMVV